MKLTTTDDNDKYVVVRADSIRWRHAEGRDGRGETFPDFATITTDDVVPNATVVIHDA